MTPRAAPPDRASGDVYHSPRLAEGYAFGRPAVHPHVARLIAQHLGLTAEVRVRRALDVGCGAGLSTAALRPIADMVVGLDPARAMLAHHDAVAPEARFVVGRAEALPFADGAFDLVTGAGSLNYAEPALALAEVARVLAWSGSLVIYDYSGGRRIREPGDLDGWFDAFERRYPFPSGYALDVTALDYARVGLRLGACERFEVALSLTMDAYLAYVLSETNVELAISRGTAPAGIKTWCEAGLRPFFEQGPLTVVFNGYVAYVTTNATEECT